MRFKTATLIYLLFPLLYLYIISQAAALYPFRVNNFLDNPFYVFAPVLIVHLWYYNLFRKACDSGLLNGLMIFTGPFAVVAYFLKNL